MSPTWSYIAWKSCPDKDFCGQHDRADAPLFRQHGSQQFASVSVGTRVRRLVYLVGIAGSAHLALDVAVGTGIALALGLFYDKSVLAIYVCWVLLTRTAQCAIIGLFRLTFHPLFPILQFYNQIVGAALKVAVFLQS